MQNPKKYTGIPIWNDEEAREWILRLIKRLGMTVEEAWNEGKGDWIWRLHNKISA